MSEKIGKYNREKKCPLSALASPPPGRAKNWYFTEWYYFAYSVHHHMSGKLTFQAKLEVRRGIV
jgi:hypothetical protein